MTTVYDSKGYKVEKIDIAQTRESYKTKYFVDDISGKNHRVFDSLNAAKNWIYATPKFHALKKCACYPGYKSIN